MKILREQRKKEKHNKWKIEAIIMYARMKKAQSIHVLDVNRSVDRHKFFGRTLHRPQSPLSFKNATDVPSDTSSSSCFFTSVI